MSDYQRIFGLRLWHILAISFSRFSSSAIGGKTPLKVWSRKAAQDYNSLRVFGCLAYYHVKKDKLDPRMKKDVFVGFKKKCKRLQNLRSEGQEIYPK